MARTVRKMEGLDQALAGFWKVRGATAAAAERALKRAGMFLLRESQKVVPVEYGNLKASGFVRTEGSGFSTKIVVGYTASYALYVHELVGMKLKGLPRWSGIGVYWGPSGQAKFLEERYRTLRNEMRRQIYSEFLDKK